MAASAWTPVSESASASGWIPVAETTQPQAAPIADPGTLQKVWNWANKGLISGKTLLNVVGDLTPGKPPDMKPGESTSDYLTRVQNKVDPNHPYWNAVKVGLAGVDKDVADTISGFTSPLGLGTIAAGGAGELGGAAGKAARGATALASAGFAAKGAGDVADAATDDTKDLPTRVQEGLQGAATMAGGAAGAAESASQITPSEVTAPVRAVVRGTNKVLAKAPGTIGASVGAAAGAATHIPRMAEVGAGAGYALGREVLPQIKLPGENIGLPKRVAGGPAVAPQYQPPVLPAEDLREPGTSPQTESATEQTEVEPESAAPAPGSEAAPATSSAVSPAADTSPKALQEKLEQSLGGQKLVPGVPLKNQPAAMKAAASGLLEGFTPVDSSALKGYKYDPDKQQLSTVSSSGQIYTHGEVTPEEAQAFQNADSKGKAWNTIRQNHVLVEKNGRPVKPSGPRTIELDPDTGKPEFSDVIAAKQNATVPQSTSVQPKTAVTAQAPAKAAPDSGEDLTSLLQQSLDQVRNGKPQTTQTDLGQLTVTPQGKGVVVPKGGVMTSADPAELTDRWGVTPKSIADTDANLRGLSPKESEDYINKLTESYKNGTPVSPVLETRDANNNIVDVDGRHRALAAKRAGVKRIPIVIRRLDVTASTPEDLTARPE